MANVQKILRRFYTKKSIQSDLNTLPDLCLLAIFSHLTILELVRAKQVCTRWQALIQCVCSRYRSLTILIGGTGDLVENSFFTIPYLSLLSKHSVGAVNSTIRHDSSRSLTITLHKCHLVPETFEWIVSTFPRIRFLTFALDKHATRPYFCMKQLIFLLDSWSGQLELLKLHMGFSRELHDPLRHHLSGQLMKSINCIQNLRHLTLDLHDHYAEMFSGNVCLSALLQLEEFAFCSPDSLAEVIFIYKTIQKSASLNPCLQRISLGNMRFLVPNFEITSLEDFAPRLIHLNLTLNTRNFMKIRHFINLSFLKITLPQESNLTVLCQAIASLKRLIYLHLYIDCDSRLPLSNEDAILQEFPRISSVRILTLELVNNYNHQIVISRQFEWIFPNLEVIEFQVETLLCKMCSDKVHSQAQPKCSGSINYLNDYCIRRMARPLKKCNQLSGIFVRFTNTNIVFRFK